MAIFNSVESTSAETTTFVAATSPTTSATLPETGASFSSTTSLTGAAKVMNRGEAAQGYSGSLDSLAATRAICDFFTHSVTQL